MAKKIIESKKRCIWMDAGVIDFKLCESDFDCQSCQFDRAMTESATQQTSTAAAGGEACGPQSKDRAVGKQDASTFRGTPKMPVHEVKSLPSMFF